MTKLENNNMRLIMENWRGYQDDFSFPRLEKAILEDLDKLDILIHELRNPNLILSEAGATAVFSRAGDVFSGLLKKGVQIVKQTLTVPLKLLGVILKKMADLFESLLAKMPDKNQRYIKKTIKKNADALTSMLEEDLGEDWIKQVKEVAIESMQNMQKEGLIPRSELPKADIKKMFEQNRDKIAARLKKDILKSPILELVKPLIKERAQDISQVMADELSKGFGAKAGGFAVGTGFMFGFGAVDNFGLWAGVEAIEEWVAATYPSMTISEVGMIGNTFSDVLGVFLGGAIAYAIYKLTGMKGEGTIAQAAVGVAVGCILPLVISIFLRAQGIMEEQIT